MPAAHERKGLDESAYRPLGEGETYPPYVPAVESPAETTIRAVAAGIVFGILFGAANAYLGLKSGLTISTSIPIAVLTVALFKVIQVLGARPTILESNMSQTIGSASSSVASGVIFTLPALYLWGMDPPLLQMTMLAICGGLLGTLFMIPLRRLLIEGEHGRLPYPEGTACAEVLVASHAGGSQARPVFLGLIAGAVMKMLTSLARVIPDEVDVKVPFIKKGEVGLEVSSALFGVGYILGPRIGAVMVGGGLLSSLVIIPVIAIWGEGRMTPFYPETVLTIAQMGPSQIWTRYVRYIGAGAVATGGLITLIRSLPMMLNSMRIGAREVRRRMGGGAAAGLVPRTSIDLSLGTIGVSVAVILLVMAIVPFVFGPLGGTAVRIVAALLVVVFAFFFVTVSSRIVGLVGVTSNPTSGMTIASLLGTSTIFYFMGWTDDLGRAAALTVGCVVAIAASIAGDISQDLKTGFLLGATPRSQQIGEMAGVLTCAGFVCLTLIVLDQGYGFGTTELPAPQATLMKVVIEGVLQNELPWLLVGVGSALAILAELFRIPSLPFAVGVYLPVSTMTPLFLGGLLRWWMERTAGSEQETLERRENGVLLGSGLVGGTGLLGVAIAAVAAWKGSAPEGFGTAWAGSLAPIAGALVFAAMVVWFAGNCRRAVK